MSKISSEECHVMYMSDEDIAKADRSEYVKAFKIANSQFVREMGELREKIRGRFAAKDERFRNEMAALGESGVTHVPFWLSCEVYGVSLVVDGSRDLGWLRPPLLFNIGRDMSPTTLDRHSAAGSDLFWIPTQCLTEARFLEINLDTRGPNEGFTELGSKYIGHSSIGVLSICDGVSDQPLCNLRRAHFSALLMHRAVSFEAMPIESLRSVVSVRVQLSDLVAKVERRVVVRLCRPSPFDRETFEELARTDLCSNFSFDAVSIGCVARLCFGSPKLPLRVELLSANASRLLVQSNIRPIAYADFPAENIITENTLVAELRFVSAKDRRKAKGSTVTLCPTLHAPDVEVDEEELDDEKPETALSFKARPLEDILAGLQEPSEEESDDEVEALRARVSTMEKQIESLSTRVEELTNMVVSLRVKHGSISK